MYMNIYTDIFFVYIYIYIYIYMYIYMYISLSLYIYILGGGKLEHSDCKAHWWRCLSVDFCSRSKLKVSLCLVQSDRFSESVDFSWVWASGTSKITFLVEKMIQFGGGHVSGRLKCDFCYYNKWKFIIMNEIAL